ncbi:head maturation protease, ClpP-related [Atopobacter phocae]|uniref:head maturation protease, ClpP-related n=1 Tax=Atopobacter phocae TaxID=136492 RepID=UPI00047255E0|nr:head maturation protease, ClpP-related [Atopobacter phocae]
MKELAIKGTIIDNNSKDVYDYFEIEHTAPKDIINELDGDDIKITVNSYGGLVNAGVEIYTALKAYEGNVTIDVVTAGSAASVIAMAGDTVRMSPAGQLMIHNVWTQATGDHNEMDHTSQVLKQANHALANAYQLKTGRTHEEIIQWMDEETWITAKQAVELGFADEVLFTNDANISLLASVGTPILSQETMNKLRQLKQNKQENKTEEQEQSFIDQLFF